MNPELRAVQLERIRREKERRQSQVVATTQDGGRIVRNNAGALSYTSPGYSTTDPEAVRRLMQGATPAEVVGESFDRQIIDAAPGGVAGGLVAKGGQGAFLAGEWIDEGLGAAGVNPRGLRQLQGAMGRQHPVASIGAEIAGGVVSSAPLAIPAIDKMREGVNLTQKVVRGAGIAGGGGALEGAFAAAGRANDGNRGDAAGRGALVGAGLGAALGSLGVIGAEAIESMVGRIKKLDVDVIADELGVSPPAARMVRAAVQNDDLDQAAAIINRLGDDAMLADAGEGTGALLDAASKTGGRALRVTSQRVQGRANQAGQRLNQVLDDILGPADGLRAAQRGVSQRTAAAREAAYNRAWATPIDYSTGGKGERILEVMQRIPSRYLDPAIRRANDRAQMAGDGMKAIMASIDDAGGVTFSELPNMRQLHEIKVALDDIVRDGTDALTGKRSPDAVDASRVVTMLRESLKDASGAYRAASRLGGDKIAEEQALMLGRRLLRGSTTFEDALDVMRGASKEAKFAAQRGMREHIENTLSNVRRTITDPNTDAREAMQLVKEMSSRANMRKARLVLGTNSKRFFDELDRAEAALALRAAVSRNSQTAIRQSITGQARDELQPSLLKRIAGKGGNPLEATQQLSEELAGIDPRNMSLQEQKMMGEIADVLTKLRGQDAQQAVTVIRRAMAGQPLKQEEAAEIGRLVGGAILTGGYQAGTQPLSIQ